MGPQWSNGNPGLAATPSTWLTASTLMVGIAPAHKRPSYPAFWLLIDPCVSAASAMLTWAILSIWQDKIYSASNLVLITTRIKLTGLLSQWKIMSKWEDYLVRLDLF